MCSDWWISILGLGQFFFCICHLSILAVILIKHNENANINGRKREANMIEHNRQE